MSVDAFTYFENQAEEIAEYPLVISVFLTCEFSGYVFLEWVERQTKRLHDEAVNRNRSKRKRTVHSKVIDPDWSRQWKI